MAVYSKNTLVTMLRDELNEPIARVFTDTQLDNFLDLGAIVVSAITFGTSNTEAETLILEQFEYATSDQYIFVESAEYSDGATPDVITGLQRVHPEVFGTLDNTAGVPKIFTHFANTLFLFPRPSASEVGKVVTIKGYTEVSGYDDGSDGNETLDDDLQILPFYYALSKAYARLGKHQLSAVNMQTFIVECNQHRIDVGTAIRRVDGWDQAKIPDVTVTPQ